MRLGYKPVGMSLNRYVIDEEQRKVYLFYNYNSEVIRYTMYMNDTDSSFSQKDLDVLIDEYEIGNEQFDVYVEEYQINNSLKKRYIAEFEYQDVQYQLMGSVRQEEFDKIINNLFFAKE